MTDYLHVPSPASWQNQVIYFVMTDRFANGDPTNDDQHANEFDPSNGDKYSGGDLQGIIDHLDYIQNLGATAVWITPPVANMWWDPLQQSGGYHGYWARHLEKVDEHQGTLETYQKLATELHKRGMYLIQDVVPNHMGNFFQYASYDPNDVTAGFVKNSAAVPTSKPEQSPFDQDDVTDPAQKAAAIYHWTPAISDYTDLNQQFNYQVSDLDDLNSENPVVRKALKESYGYWIANAGVDAFRVDTVKYVPHDFWNDFFWSTDPTEPGIMAQAKAAGHDNFFAFGEVFETSPELDDTAEQKVAAYLGTTAKPELPALLAYPLYDEIGEVFASGKPTANMTYRLGKFMDPALFPNPYLSPTFMDNHDVRRFLSIGTGDAMRGAICFMFTIPGIPIIYQGTEQNFTETRAAMFDGGFHATGDHFGTNFYFYGAIKALSDMRRGSKALTEGTLQVIADNATGPGVLAFLRVSGDEKVLVLMNTADEKVVLSGVDSTMPAGTVLNVMHNELNAPTPQINADGKFAAVLPARSVLIASATAQTVTPVAPAATITFDASQVQGKTFTGDVTLTGSVSPVTAPVSMVLDGYVSKGTAATVAADGTFSVTLPVSSFPAGQQTHAVLFYSTATKDGANPAVTPSMTFSTNVVFNGQTISVDDPVGDDKGPFGTYTYPMDSTFHHEMDITNVTLEVGATTLRMKITMADLSTVWAPPLGFDHVAFNIYFSFPGQSGVTVMPKLGGDVPQTGFSWEQNQFTFGWTNAMYGNTGASLTAYGPVNPTAAPSITVVGTSKTIIFTYDRNQFGLATWTGTSIYVSTWDFDGIGNGFRPLTQAGGEWAMGGSDGGVMVMDDLAPIVIPPP